MKTLLMECVAIVKDLVAHDYLYFDTPVEVKLTPHSFPFNAWAVCVSPADELYVMDSNEEWHQLEATDNNFPQVVGSLYQRLKLMRIRYAKAS